MEHLIDAFLFPEPVPRHLAWNSYTNMCTLVSVDRDGVSGCSMKVSPKGWVAAVGMGMGVTGPFLLYKKCTEYSATFYLFNIYGKHIFLPGVLGPGKQTLFFGGRTQAPGDLPPPPGIGCRKRGAGDGGCWPGPRSGAHPQPALGVGDSCVWSLVGAVQRSILLVASPARGCLSVASGQELLFPITCSSSTFCICSRRPWLA